tara:strand:- start:1392 stop:1736 length:345 start_codon:yes stop_codon:yes gene_type:complete
MYKYLEIEDYFNDWLKDNDMTVKQAYEKYGLDLYDFVFNQDYFIIGYYKAEQWLINDGDNMTFQVLNHVNNLEQEYFGEISTVFDNAETLVNHYAYWVGRDVVAKAIEKLEEEE